MPSNYAEAGMVRIPEELSQKLRAQLRITESEAVANAPIGLLMRYIAARAAGYSKDEAVKYLYRINVKSQDQTRG